jgi:folate-binding protein YgfZ
MKTPAYLDKRDWLLAKGSDSERFLSGMWTADIKRAIQNGPGTAGRSFLLNQKGKLVTEAVFLVLDKVSILFSLSFGSADQTQGALEKLLVADDVELSRESGFSHAWIVPRAEPELCERLGVSWKPLAPKVPDAKDHLFNGAMDKERVVVPRGQHSETSLEIWVKEATVLEFLTPMTAQEFECECVRAGVPRFGHDMKVDDLVLEFPHLDAISFHKGCYIGQEVVARATYRGRMTRGFAILSFQNEPQLGFLYLKESDGQPVGKITSKCGKTALGLMRFSAIQEKTIVDSHGNLVTHIEEVKK